MVHCHRHSKGCALCELKDWHREIKNCEREVEEAHCSVMNSTFCGIGGKRNLISIYILVDHTQIPTTV
jgi:hypothetical protein